MSVKHVEQYYQQICDQYKELLENIKDAEADLQENLVSPEYIDNLKQTIEPFKLNYNRWTYMMYLLRMPQKKEKQKRYEKQNKSLLKNAEKNDVKSVLTENSEVIKNIKHIS